MRELWRLARGAWDHTARLCGVVVSLVASDEDAPPQPSEFNPLRPKEKKASNVLPYNPAMLEALQERGLG